jgi:manganese oxidase
MRILSLLLIISLGCTSCAAPTSTALPVVIANDNRASAGTLRNGVLTVGLDVVVARWYPEAPDGPFVDVPVFAEQGKAPMVPAPLIRVPQGTRVRMVVRNRLPTGEIGLWGMGATMPGDTGTLALTAGRVDTLEFTAGTSGSYMYGARSEPYGPSGSETEQLAGAIVVDEPGRAATDRVFVMNIWYVANADGSWRNVYAINGRSWPYTERFDITEGDTLSWRVINPTIEQHPMHLHGAYYRVDARGDAHRDTTYSAPAQRMVVTELMEPHSTMRLTWSPATPGNWLFHCHNSYHVSAAARLNAPPDGGHDAHSSDPEKHMAGLVMGIAVRPRTTAVERSNVRALSAVIAQGVARDTAHVAPITLALPRTPNARVEAPRTSRGALLVLTRGEPTDITVHNTLREPTSIHWHGLELESWSDGVAGISGMGTKVAPPIAPGDSFVARLTLKRAGTFIYHTHLNDHAQLSAGLYGPLVVLEPGQQWNSARDLIFTAGLDETALKGPAVNGDSSEAAFTMRLGETVRLRFVNIQPEWKATFELVRDTGVTAWRPVAKDGFELPTSQSRSGPARRSLWPGETFDAEFLPTEAGSYQLQMISEKGAVAYRRQLRVGR